MASLNVGTLKIRIEVEGANAAKRDVDSVSKNLKKMGNLSIGDLLAKLNRFRWAMMSLNMLVGYVSSAIKFKFGITKKTFEVVGKAINNSFLAPLHAVKKLIPILTASVGALGAAFVSTGMKQLSDVESRVKEARPLFEFGGGGVESIGKKPIMDKEMMNKSITIATKYGVAIEDVASAFYDFASAGIPYATAMKGMDAATRLSIASGMKLGDSIEMMFSSMRALGKYTGDAEQDLKTFVKFSDTASVSVLQSQMRFSDMGAALKNVASIAGVLNNQFNQVSATLAVLANLGVKGATAGTVIKTVMGRLAENSGKAKTALDELGITVDQLEMGDLRHNFELITNALNKVSDENKRAKLTFDLLGQRGAKMAGVFTNTSIKAFDKYIAQMEDSAGATQKIADVMSESLLKQINRIKNAIIGIKLKSLDDAFTGKNGAIKKIADKLKTLVDPISNALSPMFEKLNNWLAEKIPKAIDWFVSVLPTVTTVISEMVSTVSSIIGRLYQAIVDSGVMQRIKSWFVENWQSVKGTVLSIVDSIAKSFSDSWKNFDIGHIFDNIKHSLETVATWLNTKVSGKTGADRLTETFTKMGDTLTIVSDKITEVLDEFFTTKKEASGANTVLDNFNSLLEAIAKTFDDIDPVAFVSAIQNLSSALTNIAKSTISSTINDLITFLSDKEAMENIKSIVDGINNIYSGILKIADFAVKHPELVGLLGGAIGGMPFGPEGMIAMGAGGYGAGYGYKAGKEQDKSKQLAAKTFEGGAAAYMAYKLKQWGGKKLENIRTMFKGGSGGGDISPMVPMTINPEIIKGWMKSIGMHSTVEVVFTTTGGGGGSA